MNNRLFEKRTEVMRSSRQVVEHAISRAKSERGSTWELAARQHKIHGEQWPEEGEPSNTPSPTSVKERFRSPISK